MRAESAAQQVGPSVLLTELTDLARNQIFTLRHRPKKGELKTVRFFFVAFETFV